MGNMALVIIAYAASAAIFLYYRQIRQERTSRSFDLILNIPLVDYSDHFEGSSEEERLSTFEKLNKLEAISLGITRGFYEESVVYEYMAATLINAYRRNQSLITEFRSKYDNPKLYIHIEAMARIWENRRGEL